MPDKFKTRRPIAARRTFDGKSYKLADVDNKRDITNLASSLRKRGFNVRVIQVKDAYALYRRKKIEQDLSPRKSGSGAIHVRSHARKRTKGVKAHTRKR